VSVQDEPSFSVNPAGTGTRNTNRLRRGRKCGLALVGTTGAEAVIRPAGTSISSSQFRFM
jgi:hypothetical protein